VIKITNIEDKINEEVLTYMLAYTKEKLTKFARYEIKKELGRLCDPAKIYKLELVEVFNYRDLKIPTKDKLDLLEKGIWPKYYGRGSYHDPSVAHSDYDGSSFDIFVSTNFSLLDYLYGSSPADKTINCRALFFLRKKGITSDLWRKIIQIEPNLKDFCHRRTKRGEKSRILKIIKNLGEKTCTKMKYDSFILLHNHFCNGWV